MNSTSSYISWNTEENDVAILFGMLYTVLIFEH